MVSWFRRSPRVSGSSGLSGACSAATSVALTPRMWWPFRSWIPPDDALLTTSRVSVVPGSASMTAAAPTTNPTVSTTSHLVIGRRLIGRSTTIAMTIPLGFSFGPARLRAGLERNDTGIFVRARRGVRGVKNGISSRVENSDRRGSNGPLAQATRGQLDGALPRARNRTRVVRGLHLAGVLRARARGGVQARVAERRTGRPATAQRQLLHQGDRGRQHVRDCRARHERSGARVPQHLPSPR